MSIIKKLFCCALCAVIALFVFSGCGPKYDDITEAEVMAFYEKYVEADNFQYLITKTFEDIRDAGVPQYVLDRWGLEYESLEEFEALAEYVSPEDMAQLEPLNTGEWTYYNVFKQAEIQALMDEMWGTDTIDASKWYEGDKSHYISQNGYMVAFVVATGWYDITWIEFDGIELDGTKAAISIKALMCSEVGDNILHDYSKMGYVYERGEYVLAYPVIAEDFDPYTHWEMSIDEILAELGMARDDIGTIKLEFEMTKEGMKLVKCGPDINYEKPE